MTPQSSQWLQQQAAPRMHDTEQTIATLTVSQGLQAEPVGITHVLSCSVCQLSCDTAEQTIVTKPC